jgi:hypothetical protein
MPFKQFNLAALHDIDDGKAAKAFDRLLARMIEDCNDRPSEKKPRKVTIQVDIIPVAEADGTCDNVDIIIRTKAVAPPMQSRSLSLGLRGSKTAVYNEDRLDDIDQPSLFENSEDDDEEDDEDDKS